MEKNKQPKIYLVFKILAPIFLVAAIVLIVLGTAVYPQTYNGNPVAPNPALFAPGFFMVFIAILSLVFGFVPEIKALQIKTQKYVQEENKKDLTQIVDTGADIVSDGVTKTAAAFKKGMKETMYCKHSGAEIDSDSKFCKKCGKEQ